MNLRELKNAPPDVRDRELRRMIAESERFCSAEGVDVVLSEDETRALNLPPSRYSEAFYSGLREINKRILAEVFGKDRNR